MPTPNSRPISAAAPALRGSVREAALGLQQPHRLADEEGIALGHLEDGAHQALRCGPAGRVLDEASDVGLHESAQEHAPEVRLLRQQAEHLREWMLATQLHVAVGPEQPHARVAHPAHQEVQESQARLVGPVQIVEQQQ
jgi:hypothetical protein